MNPYRTLACYKQLLIASTPFLAIFNNLAYDAAGDQAGENETHKKEITPPARWSVYYV